MKTSSMSAWLALAATTLVSGGAWAQLGQPTEDELKVRSLVLATVPRVVSGRAIQASADPRDFSGVWRSAAGRGGGGAGGGGGGAGVGVFSNERAAPAPGDLPYRILCLPTSTTQVGSDGPLLLIQTPEQITWASEEMHAIRRIFLTGSYTRDFKPNYYGEALGHWEDNTLVIETVGMKSLPAGAKMVERWTKGADGRTLQMQIGYVDAGGKQMGSARTQTLALRPDDQLLEWICEDYSDGWMPGGANFEDQVGKSK